MKDQIKAALLERKRSEAEEVFIVSLRDRLEKQGRIVMDKKKVEALAGVKSRAKQTSHAGRGDPPRFSFANAHSGSASYAWKLLFMQSAIP